MVYANPTNVLSYLRLKGVGSGPDMALEPGARLNLITGDNGLGKTFLLDVAWWTLTGHWLDYQADPTNRHHHEALIAYRLNGDDAATQTIQVPYDWRQATWQRPETEEIAPGLLLYAKADNSFAIWDPTQQSQQKTNALVFSPHDVWFGLEDAGTRQSLCEGLLRDWVTWQTTKSDEFMILQRVLQRLSPPDMGDLQVAQPTRIPNEKRLIPTLALPYGNVPVLYASEGMKRIIAAAYLLVWAWSEHKTQAQLTKTAPQRRMVILFDEIEAHLHPKWQRLIVPALIDVQRELSKELAIQFFITTHSPLVMASVEPIFNRDMDKLFKLDLNGQDVVLNDIPFVRHGVVDAWLSELFELGQPRSVAAEQAIQAAKAIQLEDQPDPAQVQAIHEQLARYLAADDEFWPRWLYFAEQNGATI